MFDKVTADETEYIILCIQYAIRRPTTNCYCFIVPFPLFPILNVLFLLRVIFKTKNQYLKYNTFFKNKFFTYENEMREHLVDVGNANFVFKQNCRYF